MAKPNKQRGPKSLIDPKGDKRVSAPAIDEDWQKMRPAWRLSLLEMHDPFGWHKLAFDTLQQIAERLSALESSTWKEILYRDGYRNHFIAKNRLCGDAQQRLSDLEQDDIDTLMSLGITQKSRVFGIMEHNVMKVLWWDPDHLVCPTEKPNT